MHVGRSITAHEEHGHTRYGSEDNKLPLPRDIDEEAQRTHDEGSQAEPNEVNARNNRLQQKQYDR
jgi:hypothetical protein